MKYIRKKKEDEEVSQEEEQEQEEEREEHKIRSKKFYIAMLLVSIIICLVFKYVLAQYFKDFYSFKSCNDDLGCVNNQAVYRISFGCFMFFLIMGIATYLPNTSGSSIHLDWWCIKIIGFIFFLGIGFLIPNVFFVGFSYISRWVSVIFLLLQILILVDFAYDLHEHLTHEDDPEGNEMSSIEKAIYLGISLLLFILSVVGSVLLYLYFPSCSMNTSFISISLVVGLILVFISSIERIGKGFLPPTVVFAYGVWLTFQAISSIPDTICNPWAVKDERFGIILLNMIITVFSITYVCGQTAAQAPAMCSGFCCTKNSKEDEEQKNPPPQYWFFHWTLSLASMYMAMILTNWGLSNGSQQGSIENKGWQNVCVKIIPAYLTFLLFFWTLLAPVCCSGRDFSDDNNRFNKN